MTGKRIAVIAAGLALAVCFGVPFLCLFGAISFRDYIVVFNIASLAWFVAAPVAYGIWGRRP